MIGAKISPALEEYEEALWSYEINIGGPPEFTKGGFGATLKLFHAAMVERVYLLGKEEKMDVDDIAAMVIKMSEGLRDMVHTYTGIVTDDLAQETLDRMKAKNQ